MTIQQQQQQPPTEPSPYLSPFYVVGVEQRVAPGRFHAVLGLFDNNRHFGFAVCGLSADKLTIVAELLWDDVLPEQRCPACAEGA